MKRIGLYLMITVTMICLFALANDSSKAQQVIKEQSLPAVQPPAADQPAAPAQAAPPAEGRPAAQPPAATGHQPQGAQEAVRGPVNSAEVIPPGPQWLGAPIMPGERKISEGSGRYVTEFDKPYQEVLAWYQKALSRYPDTRFRDWEHEMYIEDQGGSKWHAIKISKGGGAKTTVTIQKDNWTWIIATLVIRFIGVFVVLLVLWAGLNISGAIMKRFVKEEAAPAKA